jgi:hypothetical protein
VNIAYVFMCFCNISFLLWYDNTMLGQGENAILRKLEAVSQPHFWKNVRMTFTFPKWGLGSPLGLPKLQSLIAGVKTPRLEVFRISLESYRSVDVENGLA